MFLLHSFCIFLLRLFKTTRLDYSEALPTEHGYCVRVSRRGVTTTLTYDTYVLRHLLFNAAVYSPVVGRVVFSSIFVALGLFVYAVDISTVGYKLFSSSIFLHLISVVFGSASLAAAIVSYSSSGTGSTSGLLECALSNGQACVCYAIASRGKLGFACRH